jgi:DNA-binding transcriptional MerR regulator
MKELCEATGMPRTAIHHYQREGLLPPAEKTATNAAVYGPEHVGRLELIRALRGDELGPFGLDRVRAIVEMVDGGVAPEVAAALLSLPGAYRPAGGADSGADRGLSLSEVARDAGISLSTCRELLRAGLLVASDGEGKPSFDGADVGAAKLVAGLLGEGDIRVTDLEPVAELVAETVRYERALMELSTARLDPATASSRRRAMYRSLLALHTYLFVRTISEPDEAG